MPDCGCPFLELTTVTFCRAFPVKKMIPVGRNSTANTVCTGQSFRECTAYREMSRNHPTVENVRGFTLEPEFHFHPQHLWLSVGSCHDRAARVGLDDFSQKLVGPVDRIALPAENTPLHESAPCLTIHAAGRTVQFPSPCDGVVVALNHDVAVRPSLVNSDPYGAGWLFSLQPTTDSVGRLFHGPSAKQWLSWEVERLRRALTEDVGATATDGGESTTDISSRLTDAQFSRVANLFLGR